MFDTKKMRVNGWDLNLSSQVEIFPKKAISQGENFLNEWQEVFPRENSWARVNLGVPSLFVRLDCFVDDRGDLRIFEVEERPAGIGVTSRVSSSFVEKLSRLKKKWPNFKGVFSEQRKGNDDFLWLEMTDFSEVGADDLLLIRAEPEELQFHAFLGQSISTLTQKGNKEYGVKLGLWKEVSFEDFFSLPWDSGFCLKPLQSSKCRDVEIWHPEYAKRKKKSGIRGTSTRTRIQKILGKHGKMYLQELLEPPECSFIKEDRYKIAHRIFFGFDPEKSSWEFLGGMWNARRNLKIHGATDTIMGPIV